MHIGRIFLFLCIFLTPLHVIAAPADLTSLLFVSAAASEAAYAGELPELVRARLVAAGWRIEGYETPGHGGTVGRFFHMVRTASDGTDVHFLPGHGARERCVDGSAPWAGGVRREQSE